MKITRHAAALLVAALLLAACSQLPTLAPTLAPPPTAASQATATVDFKATNEVIIVTNEAVKTLVMATNEAVIATNEAIQAAVIATAQAAAAETPIPVMTPATIDLHLQISDGQQPLEASIRLYWADTGGEFEIGPTSDIELPLPADGVPFEMTVSADGYLDSVQVLTPTKSFGLIIRMIEE